MFIPVQVEPDVGESASGFSLPYLSGKAPQIDFVRGMIEKVQKETKKIKIDGSNHWIPYYRVVAFTFGGIEILNTEFSEEKRWEEDKRIIDQLLREI
jgi:hypothetical protein